MTLRSRPMGPGPIQSPSNFFSKTTESCAYSLTPPSNQTEICSQFLFQDSKYSHLPTIFIWNFQVDVDPWALDPPYPPIFLQNGLSYSLLTWKTYKYHHNVFISQIVKENMLSLLQKLNLKSLSEPKTMKSRWLTFFLGWCNTEFSRNLVSGEIMTYFRERDVITTGIPQNRGFPMISFWFRIGTWVPTPESELTIPVLFKTSFKYRFHPLAPPYPTPLPPPFLPPLPCPFLQPLPPTICPPPTKSKLAIKNS